MTTSRSPTGSRRRRARRSSSTTTPTTSAREAIKAFEDKYGFKIEISTFNDADEAITKICGGGVDLRHLLRQLHQISRLVDRRAAAPAEPQLHPEHRERVADLHQPLVRPGLALHRAVHHLHHRNRLAHRPGARPTSARWPIRTTSLWDPQYKGKTAVIDDWHTAMAMVLLKQGITDVNTSSEADLKMVGEQLKAMVKATSPKVTITMYNDLPAGQIGLSQMWSGRHHQRAVLPARRHVGRRSCSYWFPARRQGPGGQRHDGGAARAARTRCSRTCSSTTCSTPKSPCRTSRRSVTSRRRTPSPPDSLVAEEFIPENLRTAIVRPEYFDAGYRLLELDAANRPRGSKVWQAFKAGGS